MNYSEQTKEYFSDQCVYCEATFSVENPCWNSDGSNEDSTLQCDGECKNCAHDRQIKKLWKQPFDYSQF